MQSIDKSNKLFNGRFLIRKRVSEGINKDLTKLILDIIIINLFRHYEKHFYY